MLRKQSTVKLNGTDSAQDNAGGSSKLSKRKSTSVYASNPKASRLNSDMETTFPGTSMGKKSSSKSGSLKKKTSSIPLLANLNFRRRRKNIKVCEMLCLLITLGTTEADCVEWLVALIANEIQCNSLFSAATKQLYKWYFPSVRPSVTPFWLCPHHRIIMKFSGVITSDKSDIHAKGQGQRSKVKVTEVTTQLNRFQTVTPVWIHIWWWNETYNLIMLRRSALLFFKVICQISRSHGSKNRRIWPRLGISGL